MFRTSPPITAFQIKLRPRAAQLLALMSERHRRRPQEQAAWLIECALEAWHEDVDQHRQQDASPEPIEEEEWASPTMTVTPPF